ncbi:hypothetical protein STRDD12_00243 [Streptococcus sp. DD12]|nr:hypothetical protein STRDD12_00243 [Streptococcus sp. DD12]
MWKYNFGFGAVLIFLQLERLAYYTHKQNLARKNVSKEQ